VLTLIGFELLVIGIVAVALWVWSWIECVVHRRRTLARADLQWRLRRGAVCDRCGARRIRFESADSDTVVALKAVFEYVDGVRVRRGVR
jgi:hypothetical protein